MIINHYKGQKKLIKNQKIKKIKSLKAWTSISYTVTPMCDLPKL